MPPAPGPSTSARALTGILTAIAAILVVTMVLVPLRGTLNPTSAALVLLLPVLFAATVFGSGPALVAAAAGMICLNYFFLPPVGTFTIADPSNWVALVVFGATAITVGALSARVRRRAEEAETNRGEIARLYGELQEAFDRASEAEALRRSERLKSALLDAVTHDLRTPLTSIKAAATTLLNADRGSEDPSDGEGTERNRFTLTANTSRDLLQVIDEETDRLNRFIDSLVDLARIDADALEVERQWRVMDDIVASALARAAPRTSRHTVDVDLEPDLPALRVDARALSEVLYTLIDNAAKYSPPGTTIRITARRVAPESVDVAIEDEGPGIPPALRERVFTRFFRADTDAHEEATTSGHAPSLGMGLAIARGIVEAHDGRVWIEDGRHGRGTRVVCRIPIGDEDPLPAVGERANAGPQERQDGEPQTELQKEPQREPLTDSLTAPPTGPPTGPPTEPQS